MSAIPRLECVMCGLLPYPCGLMSLWAFVLWAFVLHSLFICFNLYINSVDYIVHKKHKNNYIFQFYDYIFIMMKIVRKLHQKQQKK